MTSLKSLLIWHAPAFIFKKPKKVPFLMLIIIKCYSKVMIVTVYYGFQNNEHEITYPDNCDGGDDGEGKKNKNGFQ